MVVSTEYHNAGNSEADQKQGLAALLAQSSPGIAKTGVLYGLAVSQTATASGSVQISQGAGVVQASFTAGASLLTNPDPTLDVLTANPMGSLARNDIVVFDALTAKVGVIVGTPNASPTDPTVPATSLKLFRLRQMANATTIPTAQMDDLRVFTSLLPPPATDTGWITAGFTPGTGWSTSYSTNYMKGRILNGRVHIRGEVKRTGAKLTAADASAPAPGNLSPDETLVTVPQSLCPAGLPNEGEIGAARADGTGGAVQLYVSGSVILSTLTTGGVINTNEFVRFSFDFPVG